MSEYARVRAQIDTVIDPYEKTASAALARKLAEDQTPEVQSELEAKIANLGLDLEQIPEWFITTTIRELTGPIPVPPARTLPSHILVEKEIPPIPPFQKQPELQKPPLPENKISE